MDDSGGIGLVVVGPPHQGVLHHPILRMARGYLCCSLLCVAFLGARGLLLILCFNRKFTRDTARVCCCCCCDVVCCGERKSQRYLFSNKLGARTRLVLWLCMFELTIKTQTAEYHSGVAARRERRWQDRPLAASPRGYWCSVSSVLVSVSLC